MRGTRRGRPTRGPARRPACRRRRRRTAGGRQPGGRRASRSWRGSAACAGDCVAASLRNRSRYSRGCSSHSLLQLLPPSRGRWPARAGGGERRFLLFVWIAGEGEKYVVEVGGVNRQSLHHDRLVVEPVQQRPYRPDAAVTGDLQGELVVARRHGEGAGRRV